MTSEEFRAAAKVAEIYFNIAAEVIGEDEVRRKRDLILNGKTDELKYNYTKGKMFYVLKNIKSGEIYSLEKYAMLFTKLCWSDVEGLFKNLEDENDIYLLDECGNCEWVNTQEWAPVGIDEKEYRDLVLNGTIK